MLTVAFTLFLPGLFFLLYVNVNQIIVDMDRQVQLVIYLQDDVPREEIERIKVDLYQREEVRSVVFVSKDEALDGFKEELGDDSSLLEGLSVNPLPPSIEVDFKENRISNEIIVSLAKLMEGREYVESVDYGGAWLDKLQLAKTMIALIGMAGGVLFMAVAIVIIGSAIRMTIFSRRTELLVMKMVGSTDWTIQEPFLAEGFIKGAIGGALAVALTYGVYNLVDSRLVGLVPFPSIYFPAVVLMGILLGVGGTYLAIKGQLRRLW
jgi:cell division transport system permease protein